MATSSKGKVVSILLRPDQRGSPISRPSLTGLLGMGILWKGGSNVSGPWAWPPMALTAPRLSACLLGAAVTRALDRARLLVAVLMAAMVVSREGGRWREGNGLCKMSRNVAWYSKDATFSREN